MGIEVFMTEPGERFVDTWVNTHISFLFPDRQTQLRILLLYFNVSVQLFKVQKNSVALVLFSTYCYNRSHEPSNLK